MNEMSGWIYPYLPHLPHYYVRSKQFRLLGTLPIQTGNLESLCICDVDSSCSALYCPSPKSLRYSLLQAFVLCCLVPVLAVVAIF